LVFILIACACYFLDGFIFPIHTDVRLDVFHLHYVYLCCTILLYSLFLSLSLHRGLRHFWGLKVRGQHTCTTGRRGRSVGAAGGKK
jgi:hypothetical protein